jgi:hypothetical protein
LSPPASATGSNAVESHRTTTTKLVLPLEKPGSCSRQSPVPLAPRSPQERMLTPRSAASRLSNGAPESAAHPLVTTTFP